MGPEKKQALGSIEVSPKVVAEIAREAVLQCYGIVGMAARRRQGVWTKPLDEMRDHGGVVVHMEADRVFLDLYVVIEYGTRISEVARNVMSSVKFAVEQALGVPVLQVNVNVQGIRLGNAAR
ncbi:MAG: Asp23/Gls24 family envelope stress response protein [Chloroflexia bacterium]|nr:Asp23/Gls24 family envelope stress response protein [Chloroflexia bacterium]